MTAADFNLELLTAKVFKFEDPRNFAIYKVAELIHAGDWLGAGQYYASFVTKTGKVYQAPKTDEEVKALVVWLVQWCLDNDRYPLAARLLWTESQFDPRPHFSQLIFEGLKTSAAVMLMGSASASKSYSTGVYFLLDWLRDPEFTCVKVLGPSEKHLADNLFTHLINLHQSASIPLPGEVGDLYIGLSRRERFSSISGVVVPIGKKASGRLQGGKAGGKKRKKPHPIFGTSGRLRIFMDESEKIPAGIWKDVDNVFSNLDGLETFKIVCAFNPEDKNGPSGSRCEPVTGWAHFNIDTDEKWYSKRGWHVIRLDGFKGENVIYKRKIFAGLQTWEGISKTIENAGGYESPGYYTMARAAFPPSLGNMAIIPQGMVEGSRGAFIWYEPPTPIGAADLALEGGDVAPFYWGEVGLAVGYKTPPSIRHPQGQTLMFLDESERSIVRPALQVTGRVGLEPGDSIAVAKQIIDVANKLGIKPGALAVDSTGLGQGIFDILKNMWSVEVIGVSYMQSASDSKILEEDSKTAKEEYDRACTELWFAMRKFFEHAIMLIAPSIDMSKLGGQLSKRHFSPGKINRVESKKEYKAREGASPDDADGLSLLIAAGRKVTGMIPSMIRTKGIESPHVEDYDRSQGYSDVSNKLTDDD